MLEMIVALVVLAILAGIAVPTFARVMETSKDKTAQTSLAAFSRSVQAQVGLSATGSFSPEHFTTASEDFSAFSAAPGVSAAGRVYAFSGVRATRSQGDVPAVISYAIDSEDRTRAGVAAVSSADNCIGLRISTTSITVVEMPEELRFCTGDSALTGAEYEGPVVDVTDPANPSSPIPLDSPTVSRSATGTTPTTAAIEWTSVGAPTYVVEAADTQTMSGSRVVYTGPDRRYVHPITADRVQYLAVTAVSGEKRSQRSPGIKVSGIPAAPQNVTSSARGDQVTVTWDAVQGAEGYYLYQDGSSTFVRSVSDGSTTTTFTVPSGSTSSFVVRAYNWAGSSEASGTATSTTVPAAPTGVTALVAGRTATLEWSQVSGADGYYVYQDGASTFTRSVPGATTTSTTFELADGQSSTFVIRAYNVSGAGEGSAPVTATVVPGVPSGVRTSVSGTTVTLDWTPVSGSTSYDVFRDGAATPTLSVTAAQAQFTLDYGMSASFTVRAVNGSGTSPESPSVRATIVPLPPTDVTSAVSGRTVTVSWTGSRGAEGYYVYREGSSTVAATAVGGSASSAAVTITDGETASFVVRAYNAGGTSAVSGTVVATAVPAAPQNFSVTLSGKVATLRWDGVSGALGYYVYQDDSGTLTRTVPGQDSTTTQFTLSDGQTASFVVKAYNDGGAGLASSTASVTVVPATPTGLKVTMDGLTAVVTWDATSGATSYDVYQDAAATPQNVTGTRTSVTLQHGQTSSFKVAARNSSGPSPSSAAVSVTVVPAAPQNVRSSIKDTTATITWDTVSGADGYYVYHEGSSTVVGTAVGGSAKSVDVTVPAGQTAVFVVRAYNAGGTSAASASTNVTGLPTAPQNLRAAVSGKVVTLTWDAVANTTGYNVYQDAGTLIRSITDGSTTTTVTLVDGQTASFVVRAVNGAGSSVSSDSVSATAVPAVPTGLKAVVSGTTATVSWNATSGATGYSVYRDGSATPVDVKGGNSATFTLTQGGSATFTVAAYNGTGPSAKSAPVTATSIPAPPTNVSATAKDTTVTVSWTPSSGANGYRIYQDGAGTFTRQVLGQATSSETFTVPAGSSASFVVRSYNDGGESAASNSTSVDSIPLAPQNFTASISGNTVTLSWTATAKATGYYVYQDGAATFTRHVLGGSTTSTQFTLSAGQTSSFVLRAVNNAGASEASAPASATSLPGTPTGVTAKAVDNTVTLSWNAVEYATGYYVYRDGSNTIAATVVGDTKTTFTVADSQSASFRVAARNSAGAGVPSEPVSAVARPAAPVNVKTAVTGTTATISWDAVTNAKGYYVYQDGGATAVATKVAPETSATITLSVGQTAKFVVRAYNDSGTSAASAESTGTAVLAAPVNVKATPRTTDTTAVLTWDPVPGATGYTVHRTAPGSGESSVTGPTQTTGALTPGVDYVYHIRTVNDAGSSAPSSSVTVRASYAGVVSMGSPVGYYKLDETSATASTAANSRGSLPALTYGSIPNTSTQATRGAASIVPLDGGRSTTFASDGNSLAQAAVSSFPTGSLSVEFWVKCNYSTANQAQAIISYAANANGVNLHNAFLLTEETNHEARLFFGDGVGYAASYPFPGVRMCDGNTNHVALTWDQATSTATLYKNGTRAVAVPNVSKALAFPATGNLVLGQDQDALGGGGFDATQALKGSLDEVSIYGSALSAAQVADHFRAGTDTLAAPGNPRWAASLTSRDTTFSWDAVPGAASYRVTRLSNGATATVTGTSWTANWITPGVPLDFAVQAVDGAGNLSGFSRIVSMQPSYAGVVTADKPVAYYRLTDSDTSITAKNHAAGVAGITGAYADGRYCRVAAGTVHTTAGDCAGAMWGTGSSPVGRDATADSAYFGGNGYVDLPDTGNALTADGFTMEAWAYSTDSNATWSRIVEISNGPDSNNVIFSRHGNGTSWTAGGRKGIIGQAGYVGFSEPPIANGLPLNTWSHLAVTVTAAGNVTFYINGAQAGTATGYDYNELTRTFAAIGRSTYTQDAHFKGYLAEVAVYHTPLSGTQIKSHYDAR